MLVIDGVVIANPCIDPVLAEILTEPCPVGCNLIDASAPNAFILPATVSVLNEPLPVITGSDIAI